VEVLHKLYTCIVSTQDQIIPSKIQENIIEFQNTNTQHCNLNSWSLSICTIIMLCNARVFLNKYSSVHEIQYFDGLWLIREEGFRCDRVFVTFFPYLLRWVTWLSPQIGFLIMESPYNTSRYFHSEIKSGHSRPTSSSVAFSVKHQKKKSDTCLQLYTAIATLHFTLVSKKLSTTFVTIIISTTSQVVRLLDVARNM